MTDVIPGRNRSIVDFIRQTGGSEHRAARSFCTNDTISLDSCSDPRPTTFSFLDVLPETFKESLGVFVRSFCHSIPLILKWYSDYTSKSCGCQKHLQVFGILPDLNAIRV